MESEPRAGNLTSEHDLPFSGYSATDLRESANYLASLQDAPRRRFRRGVEPPGWIAMSWVSHTLDALDLLEEIVEEWDARGDGGCTKAIQDRVREALRGEEDDGTLTSAFSRSGNPSPSSAVGPNCG